jgi:hypothetical protein
MDHFDLISRYLEGEMNEQERLAFEKKIKDNPELAKEIKLHRDIDDTIKDTKLLDFYEQLESIHKKLKKEGALEETHDEKENHNRRLYLRWYNIAAAIIILLVISTVLYFTLRPPLNERLYSQFFKPYNGSYIVRSAATQDKYSKASDTYDSANYEKSWNMFNELIKVDTLKINAMFFKGISAMEINKYDDAINSFNFIIKDNSTLFVNQAEWYLALCYLKNNDMPNAKKLFGEIAESNASHKSDAKRILKKLSE